MCVLGEANEVAHSAELDYRIRVFVPYMYPLYVSLICAQVGGDGGPATTKLEYVFLICIPYMDPLYVRTHAHSHSHSNLRRGTTMRSTLTRGEVSLYTPDPAPNPNPNPNPNP